MTKEEKQHMDINGHTPLCEDYISFEIAKLLKEKGFDTPGKVWYAEYTSQFSGEKYNSLEFDDYNRFNGDYKFLFYVPTLQMAMKWLRENYNIHIEVRYFPMPNIYRYVIIHSPATFENIDSHPQYFNTYEEACEAAIKYCLENLI